MPYNHPQPNTEIPNVGGSINVEFARLLMVERRRIECAGGLFPERENELDDFERVLDVSSGTGTWSLHVAQRYPEIEVMGLERQYALASYATSQAEARKVGNVCYLPWKEPLTRLDFPDHLFDVVNVNFLFMILHPDEWLQFFQECLRVTRPGGYIRVNEHDWGMTNSPAIEQLAELFLGGLKKANLGLSPNGRYIGALPYITLFLKQAGWQEVQRRVVIDDYIKGSGLPSNAEQAMALMANTMRPLTLSQEMISAEEYQTLLAQAAEDFTREDFCSLLLQVSFSARKPLTATAKSTAFD